MWNRMLLHTTADARVLQRLLKHMQFHDCKPSGKSYSLELGSFILCPHHSTFRFVSIPLQQSVLLCSRRFKAFLCWTLPAEHTELFSGGTVAISRTKKRGEGVHSGWCVLCTSHGSVSIENTSQGGRRFSGVFLNRANKGFPLHDQETFLCEINRNG